MAIVRDTLKSYIGGASILVAERDPLARTSLSELFRFDGHHVHEAADGNSALIQLQNDPATKVIMLDVEMPSWRSVATHARDTLPAAVVLGMSIQDSNRALREAQQLGVHGYLLKPLVFDDVCETILRIMAGQPLR